MSKALCIISLAISAILLLVFLLDLMIGVPFGRANMAMDLGFVISCAGLGTLGFFVFRRLK